MRIASSRLSLVFDAVHNGRVVNRLAVMLLLDNVAHPFWLQYSCLRVSHVTIIMLSTIRQGLDQLEGSNRWFSSKSCIDRDVKWAHRDSPRYK